MTGEEKIKIVDRINSYADKVLQDIDPQKTPISMQLDALKPEMQKIAEEYNMKLEDIFILYMDMNTMINAKKEREFQDELKEHFEKAEQI